MEREVVLPREMWELIMAYLTPADLCSLALVSRYINRYYHVTLYYRL